MRSLKTSLLWSAVILLVITASANADRQLIDLGLGLAHSINNNGQIIGSTKMDGTGYPILFDPTGGKANINISPIISGTRQTGVAYSINNNGQIVGYISTSVTSTSAYLFDSTGSGGGTNLGDGSSAAAINDNGWIVGYGSHALRFRPLPAVDLGTLGGYGSSAYAVNDNGRIVGWAYNKSQIYQACLFDSIAGGVNKNLGTISGFSESMAESINNLNQIVGCAFNISPNPSNIMSAVLFNSASGGANINLGALDDYYNHSIARSINDNGQIVGDAFYGPDMVNFPCRAVLFDPTGQGNNTDLNTLIDSSWTLRHAYGINNNGWIVGEMTNGSDTHAFLLTPEPASVLLFAFGGVTILRKRRM
ncbi:MAG: DUF3466 family protein [Sedimentisphaerales bacterium]